MRQWKISQTRRGRRKSDHGVTTYASKRSNVKRKTKWPRLYRRRRSQDNPEVVRAYRRDPYPD